MNVFYGPVTSKGQTTVTSEVREILDHKPDDKIRYVHSDGAIFIKAKNKKSIDLLGKFHDPHRMPFSVEEMNDAIGDAILDHVEAAR